MKKNDSSLLCVRKMLLSFAMATLVMSGYAQKTVTLYPSADIQFRSGNTTQSGTGPQFEMHTLNNGTQDYGFVAGMKFDLTGQLASDEVITAAELRLTSSQAQADIVIFPFTTDFGETGGTTDSWDAKQSYIMDAVASTPVVDAFRPNWIGGKKIFEWTDFANTSIEGYQITKDVTDYFKSKVEASEYEIGLLLAPSAASTSNSSYSIIFSKDVSADTYGTSLTNGYNDDGTPTGGTNDVTRWSRIEQLLRISGNKDVSELYPMLTLTIEKATAKTYAISTTSNPADGGSTSGDNTYSSGASCTVSATPNSGYIFVNWTEDGVVVSSDADYTFTVSADRSLVANFNDNTGIESIHSQNVSIYPNPVKNELIIENGDLNMRNEKMQIIDFTGKTVINSQFPPYNSQLKINVSDLPSGTYVLKIGNYTSKIIKK